MIYRASYTLVLTLALLFACCAATPNVREEGRTRGLSSRFSTVQVSVDAPETVRAKEGYNITAEVLQREFIEAVRASGKYSAVGTAAAGDRALEAKLTITELNYVSGAARGTVGILAGRAVLKVTMNLRDKATGAALGSVSADHSSSHLQGVFSPVTSRQITAIVNELAAKL